ncbi:centrosomal protein of 78 kDa [Pygocentrus nattereri]|uniref:Centrosomal protein 78 n=1 Tax=Pygocentrus nattereri TaxID=42514 RepID=A0A3B4CR79_PYGNA|nr:centrosomal protein of 78 kDa [Pygocentrus nattereri]
MLGSAQLKRRRAQDFAACYDSACAAQGSVPLPAVKSSLGQGVLDFNGDVISLPDWTPVLLSLAINKHLQNVTIRSCYLGTLGSQASSKATSRKKTPAIHSKSMTLQLCKAVQKCLCVSPNLKILQLHGLPLRERDLNILTKGLSKSTSLEHLSLAHCPIADDGLEVICQSVKYSSTIRTVDFTSCNITWQGAEHMANIIKHQAVRRHGTAWVESLRYRKAEFEAMGGLRRITLNDNILIGDRGVTALTEELAEDLWVKAVDLQRCGISNEGAKALEKMLQSNSTLCVLDVRRNPLVDNELVKDVIKKVLMNTKGQDLQYLWLKPPAKDAYDHTGQIMRRNTGRATYRTGSRKTSTACGWRPPRPGSAGYIPWRTAARARLQRGLPEGAITANQSFQNASTVRVTLESASESESEEVESVSQSLCAQSPQGNVTSRKFRHLQAEYKRLQVELEDCKLRLAEERNARLKANSRLVELELENSRLRSLNQSLSEAHVSHSVLEDDHVLDSIESSFHKFHAFLDLLKDAGLGQLASMAGIEQSDFGLLGSPQLSSTERRGQGDQGNEQRKEDPVTTENLQRASRPQSSRSSCRVSAASRPSPQIQSQQEMPLNPAIHSSTPPAPLDQHDAPEQQRSISPVPVSLHGMSGSEKVQGSGDSKSASSVSSNLSINSKVSNSYRDDFSEGKVSPALSSRSSSVSRFESQRSAAGLAGF